MEFLDAPLYDDDLAKLAFRFAHDLFFLALVVRLRSCPTRENENSSLRPWSSTWSCSSSALR